MPTPATPALQTAALTYAARGWHVIPLRPGSKRPAFPDHPEDRCTGRDPRCRAAGRHVTWEERSTTDTGRIGRAWASPTPAGPYGVGIAPGPSGLAVIDLDTAKPDLPPDKRARLTRRLAALGLPADATGADVLAVLLEQAGRTLPDTYTVATPSGGAHLYYAVPAGATLGNTVKALGPLVDTRARGGLVVAPPTTTPDGTYQVTSGAPVAPLPGWIADALRPAPRPAQRPVNIPLHPHTRTGRGGSRTDAYLTAAVDRERNRVTDAHGLQAPENGRNYTLYLAAVALGQLVAGGHLTAQHVTAVLLDAAKPHLYTCPDCSRNAPGTIRSGLRAGAKRPRTLTTGAAA